MLLAKKDINILLSAGFDESDLGLVPGSHRTLEIYESPGDYFAKEIIENACEQGECSLWDDEPYVPPKEYYDRSRKELWEDIEYAGNDDPLLDVDQCLRPQVEWLREHKMGRMSIWQRKTKDGYKWPVNRLIVNIPVDEQVRMMQMRPDWKKSLWISYAKEEWKKCWQAAIDSMWKYPIEEIFQIDTKKGKLDLLVIDCENLKNIGYNGLPSEANWITMVYFIKNTFKRR